MARGNPIAFSEGANHGRGGVGEPIVAGNSVSEPVVAVPGRSPEARGALPEHPRSGAFLTTMPEERQSAASSAFQGLHDELVPKITEKLHGEAQRIAGSNPAKMTPAKRERAQQIDETLQALSEMPSDAEERGVGRVRQTAMAPVLAEREHFEKTGEMRTTSAGTFYGARRQVNVDLGEHYHGDDPEKAARLRSAAPIMSARTTPTVEVQGASGIAALAKRGDDIGIHIGADLAHLMNIPENRGGWKDTPGPSAQDLSSDPGGGKVWPGEYKLSELARRHPQAAMLAIQGHARQSGLVVSGDPHEMIADPDRAARVAHREAVMDKGLHVEMPEGMEAATAAAVRSLGTSGAAKGGRMLHRMNLSPDEFAGSHTAHKIPSYTWNIEQHDETMRAGTEHFLGVLTHGSKWLEAHPEGHAALAAAVQHPAWHDPTATIDVHSGRVASGLPFHAAKMLGERTNPEGLLVGKNRSGEQRVPNKGTGEKYGSPADMGYFLMEDMHRQAAHGMSVRVPGIGTIRAPNHIVQSLSWYGVQGEANAKNIRDNTLTMAPSGMGDPRSLNVLTPPRMF